MGWITKHVEPDLSTRKVNAKKECDNLFLTGEATGVYSVKKSAMVGKTYYAAIELKRFNNATKRWEERETFAAVILTDVDNKSVYNFGYKMMDETVGPCDDNCPESILKLLSPTEDEYALDWRKRCMENAEKKKRRDKLGKLPVGTHIRFQINGRVFIAQKYPADLHCRQSSWRIAGARIPSKRIPDDYEIIE